MASKLDEYKSEIFSSLNDQAESYRDVCKWLLLKGIKISPQGVYSWHSRKMKKLANRNRHHPIRHVVPSRQRQSNVSPSTDAAMWQQLVGCPTDQVGSSAQQHVSPGHRSLADHISDEERQQKSDAISGSSAKKFVTSKRPSP